MLLNVERAARYCHGIESRPSVRLSVTSAGLGKLFRKGTSCGYYLHGIKMMLGGAYLLMVGASPTDRMAWVT